MCVDPLHYLVKKASWEGPLFCLDYTNTRAYERGSMDEAGIALQEEEGQEEEEYAPWEYGSGRSVRELTFRDPRRKELANVIRQAFKDVVLGDGIGLREADLVDAWIEEGADQREQAKLLDERKDWEALKIGDLTYGNPHCFFDALGMRFHIPAYMLMGLEEVPDETPWFTAVRILTHPADEEKLVMSDDEENEDVEAEEEGQSEYFRSRFASLTGEQRGAVRSPFYWRRDLWSQRSSMMTMMVNQSVIPTMKSW